MGKIERVLDDLEEKIDAAITEVLEELAKFSSVGWECPKCGSTWRPSVRSCIYCNSWSYTQNDVSWSTTTSSAGPECSSPCCSVDGSWDN